MQTFEEKLLLAIEYDDIVAFGALCEAADCGRFRLGRFPVLSLMYLYRARKLISAYERDYAAISAWKKLDEPARIVGRFSGVAGKCLRLYFDKTVSPLEMLLLLDKTRKLKKVYPYFSPTDEIKARMQTIYYVKYALRLDFDGGDIIIDRRPLSAKEKKKFSAIAVCCLFAAAVVITTPIVTVSYIKEHENDVTQLNQIDFSADKTYTLKGDITLPTNYRVTTTNCSIVGNGHKIVLGKNASLGELDGKFRNVTFQTSGDPIFTACTENAVLSSVTVRVNADVETEYNSAFVALTNYGTIDGVSVHVSGNVSALAQEDADGSSELIFGGVVMHNSYTYGPSMPNIYGTVKNCSVTYTGFTLNGETFANATFGGVVGVNNGIVQDCSISGAITSNTFDLAGACYVNNNELTGIVNSADLIQVSGEEWSPIVGGIAIDNTSTLERCQYTGDIIVVGQNTALCAGIVARTYGSNKYCYSSGDISVTADDAYVGGIYAVGQVASDNYYVYFGIADYCMSEVNITATLADTSYIGGIGGYVMEGRFYPYGGPAVYLGGGVTNCIFTGSLNVNRDYFGSIVGVCGANIYETNAYASSDDEERRNFDGNYYVGDAPSFGATETTTDVTDGGSDDNAENKEYVRVSGKGATRATENEIKATDTYKHIKNTLGI